MKINISFTLIIILLFSLCVYSQNATKTVSAFYKFHRSNSQVFEKKELEARETWFTKKLYKLFFYELKRQEEFLTKNPTDKPRFGDGFPFQPYEECYLNGKNYLNEIKIQKLKSESDKKIIKVGFYTPKQCDGEHIKNYKVEVVKTNKRWLINDWIYEDGKRLSEYLEREKY